MIYLKYLIVFIELVKRKSDIEYD